jgi:ferredoxin--NADP+ reductase
MVRILEKEQLAPNVHFCRVEAPDIAHKAEAGQFVMVIPDRQSERIPITISDWDRQEGWICIIFLEIGAGTERLARMKAGEWIYAFTGPLGRPFELGRSGNVALVGGCYGIGGIYPAARALTAAGNRVISYSEARAGFLLYWNEKLESVSDEVRYSTVDGSVGFKGHAYNLLENDLKGGEKFDRIITIGCTYMMYRVAEASRPFGVKTIASMNPVMIDGTGMCGACRLLVKGETRFACVDGPHFDAHDIDWDIVLSRRGAYLEEEIISKERL